MQQSLLAALQFLIDTTLTLLIVSLLLRFILQWVRANFYNPLCQLIIKATNPLVLPVRRLIPGYAGVDWACIILIMLVSWINQWILVWLSFGGAPSIDAIMVLGIASALNITYYIYVSTTFIVLISSALAPHQFNPVVQALIQLITPVLRRIQRRVPTFSGFDFSPMILLILLFLIRILMISPIKALGYALLK